MAFIDLFSSAKGPGVIGSLMGLAVLACFGVLATLALDEKYQNGGKSLEFIIRQNDAEILVVKKQIESYQADLTVVPRLKQISESLTLATGRNTLFTTEVSALTSSVSELEAGVETISNEWEDYKNLYRTHVRTKAVGTTLPELKTVQGKVYQEVEIRLVTAIGIDIRHKDGLGRIKFEDLPKEMRDYYQYDEKQMLVAAHREAQERDRHNKAIQAVNQVAEATTNENNAKGKEEQRQKAMARIATMEAQATSIEGQIRQLESDISSADSAAASARSSGRMHLNKAGSIRGELSLKRGELARVRAEIARLRALDE